MAFSGAVKAIKEPILISRKILARSSAVTSVKPLSTFISWKSTGGSQLTLAGCVERTGKGLHSGKVSTVKLLPEVGGKGRYFVFGSESIPASIHFAEESPLCTTLGKNGCKVTTVEHLLSALEAKGVDNCRIQIESAESKEGEIEVPIFDGSAREWVGAIEEVGLKVALHDGGKSVEKKAAFVNEPVHIWRGDAFVAAFPALEVHTTYGIDFPHKGPADIPGRGGDTSYQVPAIGCQWFSSVPLRDSFYEKCIASSRTFCVYEEVERMYSAGLIKGGTLNNAIVCSSAGGWLNPPLRFEDEPCRHKMLDLIGDLSLLARGGSQGLPVAHIVAYKGGHALHADFVRRLARISYLGNPALPDLLN